MRSAVAVALLAGVAVLLAVRLLGGDDSPSWTGNGCDGLAAYGEEIADGAGGLNALMQGAAQSTAESSEEIAAMVDELTSLRDRLRSMDEDGRVPPVAERYHQGTTMTVTVLADVYGDAEDGQELLALLLSADGFDEARNLMIQGESEIRSTCGSIPWES